MCRDWNFCWLKSNNSVLFLILVPKGQVYYSHTVNKPVTLSSVVCSTQAEHCSLLACDNLDIVNEYSGIERFFR